MLTFNFSIHIYCLQLCHINMSIYLAYYIQKLGENFRVSICFINVMGGTFYVFSRIALFNEASWLSSGNIAFILGFICHR